MTIRQAARFPSWAISHLPRSDLASRALLQEMQFRQARAVCTTTRWAADSVVDDCGIAPSKVRVVGLGGRCRRVPEHRTWSVPRFLFAGRDWERKNGELLLEAFAIVRSIHPNATLEIVGDHPPIRQDGVRTHGLLKLDDHQHQRQLDALFERVTCFVMPSTVEPSGLSLVEAASAALPSIVTSMGGAAEVVGAGGVAVKPGDVQDLAHAMIRLCDGGFAMRLGELARRHTEQWTWRLTAQRIIEALDFGATVASLAPLRC